MDLYNNGEDILTQLIRLRKASEDFLRPHIFYNMGSEEILTMLVYLYKGSEEWKRQNGRAGKRLSLLSYALSEESVPCFSQNKSWITAD